MNSTTFRKLSLFICIIFFSVKMFPQMISAHYFGENAWMPDTIGTAVYYGKLHKHWNTIKSSGAGIIRFGGIAPDKNKPSNFQYIKMIDSIRAKGMEPVMQVPFHKWQFSAQQAAAIVQYINITKGKNVKYWVIGNEPDLDYAYTTSAQVAAYFKPFASAMKAVDPTILTIGPECAWYNSNIINGLTQAGGPDDITGKDAAGNYYLDIVSFHTYPFNGTQTRSQVISKLTGTGGLDANLAVLNARVAAANSSHGRTGNSALKVAITEANINYQNNSADNLNGLGANSFIGGQFVAEMMGIGLKRGVDFINIWSVIEGNSTALNIGYLDSWTGNKKPLFYHFQMMADNFKGNYATSSTNQANVKTIASKTSQQTVVMIMNQELSANLNFTLRLNTNSVTGTNPLKINIDASIAAEYNDVIKAQSTILLTFNSSGVLTKKCVYTLSEHAANNLPPSCESFNTVLPIQLIYFDLDTVTREEVKLTWATATEKQNNFFTVQKSSDGITFKDVATVKGAGDSNITHYYEANDNSPMNGLSYYRLKQSDYNGNFTYSPLKTMILNARKQEMVIFPNPSDGESINIRISNGDGAQSLITIYDSHGRELFSQSKPSGRSAIVFPYRLAQGIYIMTVSTNTSAISKKFIVK